MNTETLATLAGMAQWTGSNMAYNLAKIPADKLDWKPSPEANSALEIINHLMMPLNGIPAMLEGRAPEKFEAATDLESAQALIRDASEKYAAFVSALAPESLQGTLDMPFGGTWPRERVVTLPIFDLVHHHGQIAYIQTLLGDAESHFEELGN
jgi:uncharacterized damage-inducible protein DinB